MKRIIRLRGMNGTIKGRVWESSHLLRIGRLDPLEIVLDDNSVSRHHAEVVATERGWRVRDLGSTNGTRLNSVRLGRGEWPLRARDLLQVGEVSFIVEAIEEETKAKAMEETTTMDKMRLETLPSAGWEDALVGRFIDPSQGPNTGEQLRTLLRANYNLMHIEKEEDLLNSILTDAVSVLKAQRAAIVLCEGPDQKLKLRAVVSGKAAPRTLLSGRGDPGSRFNFSQSVASRCVDRGESILLQSIEEDTELAGSVSLQEGAMSSVLCVLLRTPRKRLGVLHLDRGPFDEPFTQADLHLADALAANVSAGIECAQLVRKQRDLFLNTITILAQAVELRDEYTGDHTQRVKSYSVLLAQHIKLDEKSLELIEIGTPLHDIGKIGIDDAILRKPDRLTPQEFEEMKKHTTKGAEIIGLIPDLHPILPIVRSHHERWDGKGYPDGLAGEEIPILARVVALADAFDAMTSNRPYRKGMQADDALEEIRKGLGKQFDPTLAQAFVDIREQILREMHEHNSRNSATKRTRIVSTISLK